MGLAHVSHEENLTTSAHPTMSSGKCSSAHSAWQTVEHDDYAALMQRNGQNAGSFRRMHADPSFEEVFDWTQYWETVDVGSVEQIADANSPWGGYHLRFKGSQPLTGADPSTGCARPPPGHVRHGRMDPPGARCHGHGHAQARSASVDEVHRRPSQIGRAHV